MVHSVKHTGAGDQPVRSCIDNRLHVLRGDTAIPLRPKTWDVLVYLAERPGALVAKDALLDAVWTDTAVTPDTLNKSIGELRSALGDLAQSLTGTLKRRRRAVKQAVATATCDERRACRRSRD